MALRVPPGRAGRLWLARRRQTADRAADLLEQKRRALIGEQRRLRLLSDRTEAAWRDAVTEAERWIARAGVVGGERAIRQAVGRIPPTASVDVRWRSTMGAVYPARVACQLPGPGVPASAGQASALGPAERAHREALEAGAQHAAARMALTRVENELGVTVRRLRVIQQRWIPTLDSALHDLAVRLDEREREDLVAVRWTRDRGGPSGERSREG
jgi:V/A-type H+-transporting ATPase subunit D